MSKRVSNFSEYSRGKKYRKKRNRRSDRFLQHQKRGDPRVCDTDSSESTDADNLPGNFSNDLGSSSDGNDGTANGPNVSDADHWFIISIQQSKRDENFALGVWARNCTGLPQYPSCAGDSAGSSPNSSPRATQSQMEHTGVQNPIDASPRVPESQGASVSECDDSSESDSDEAGESDRSLLFDPTEPEANLFLDFFRDCLRKLHKGISIVIRNVTIKVRGIIICGTCDLRAKAHSLKMKLYSGAFGCQVCIIKGVRLNRVQTHPYTAKVDMRTSDESLKHAEGALKNCKDTKNERELTDVFGVKGFTELSKLVYKYIETTTVDIMHCGYVGLAKRLGSLCLPLLHDIMDEKYFNHHKLLVYGLHLLNQNSISSEMIDLAEKLLNEYVLQFADLYGEAFMTCYLHLLFHLPGLHIVYEFTRISDKRLVTENIPGRVSCNSWRTPWRSLDKYAQPRVMVVILQTIEDNIWRILTDSA
ncbi:hypothetical protein QAD02_020987 [Eretmocerus hayati]|uniref:Uncharacterized protein n=1 Tax=Eretmocerus hayati TaxID=131215 RepID=A0ACC2PNM9_9HYME|nr:hypothetical protein QAD02_020987 [Eretmocerus hayati]